MIRRIYHDGPKISIRPERTADLMNKIEKKEYLFSNDTGDAVLTIYEVFPGVRLVYNSVHMDRLDMGGLRKEI